MFLAGFKFRLCKCDEYTEKYMEDNAAVFPEASIEAIIEKIKMGAKGYKSMQEYAVKLLATIDKNNDGFIDSFEFVNHLKTLGIFVSRHEEHAIMRRFDVNGDGKISMEEFYNTLAHNL